MLLMMGFNADFCIIHTVYNACGSDYYIIPTCLNCVAIYIYKHAFIDNLHLICVHSDPIVF